MGKIQSYVLLETLKILFVLLVASSLLFTLGGGVREGIRKGLPPQALLLGLPYMIPDVLRMTIPASLLFAICTVFGRMGAAEEITALKSLGINPLCIVTPVLMLAYALSLLTFWLYDVCAVWSRPGFYRIVVSCADEVAYDQLRKEGVFRAGGVTMTTQSVQGRQLIKPILEIEQPAHADSITVSARNAELEPVGLTGKIRIHSFGTRIDLPRKATISLPDEFTHEIPVQAIRQGDDCHRSPAEIKMSRLGRQIQVEEDEIRRLKQTVAAPPSEEVRQEIERREFRLYRLQAESQRRLSNGFAVFAFAMIGIPISAGSRSADNMSVFFMCVVPIALLYYPLLVAGEEVARRGMMPAVSVWLAPVVLTVIGAGLIYKLIKY